MPFSLIPFLLLVIPLAEIAAFVVIGGQIGVFWTLAMVVVTAVIGSILLRVQGFGIVNRMRSDLDQGRLPARDLVHGVMIMIAGVLLLTPGFVTDTMGFALFVPFVRDGIWRFVRSRITIITPGQQGASHGPDNGPTIDLDAEDYDREPDPGSPWADGKQDRMD